LDPKGTGFADKELLRKVFYTLGFGSINDEELDILIAVADADNDGNISLDDFRQLAQKISVTAPTI